VAKTEYRVNGGDWQVVQSPVTLSTEGVNIVEYRSTDIAGNVENTQSIQIWIDKTAPMVSYEGTLSFYQTDAAIQLTVKATDSFSGVKEVVYALDGVPIGSLGAISPLSLSAGDQKLVVTAEDFAGNKANVTFTLTAKMDLDHLSQLISIGESGSRIANHGTAQSLQSKVANIQKAATSQIKTKMFNDLKNEIAKDSGKLMDSTFADFLLQDLNYMEAAGF
jgi:hypothetical protein